MMIEYVRVRESAKPPVRANPSDAGLDVFFCPEDGAVTGLRIEPGASAVLPTGLRFGVPHGYMLQVMNRSGVGEEVQVVEPLTKIAQLVMIPVVHFRALETQGNDLYNWYPITISDRGAGALGSTGD